MTSVKMLIFLYRRKKTKFFDHRFGILGWTVTSFLCFWSLLLSSCTFIIIFILCLYFALQFFCYHLLLLCELRLLVRKISGNWASTNTGHCWFFPFYGGIAACVSPTNRGKISNCSLIHDGLLLALYFTLLARYKNHETMLDFLSPL